MSTVVREQLQSLTERSHVYIATPRGAWGRRAHEGEGRGAVHERTPFRAREDHGILRNDFFDLKRLPLLR